MREKLIRSNVWRIGFASALLVCCATPQADAKENRDGDYSAVPQPPVLEGPPMMSHSRPAAEHLRTVSDTQPALPGPAVESDDRAVPSYDRVMPSYDRVMPGNDLADLEHRLNALEAANGFNVTSPCGGCREICTLDRPTHRLIGRMFFDQLWMDDLSGAVPQNLENMTGFRDLRLGAEGFIYENIAYKAEFQFEGDEIDYKDVYAEVRNLPWVGNFRVGHFREPMGLEHLTDARFITFMERSAATRDFAPDRNLGIMLYNCVGAGCDCDSSNLSWYASLTRGNHNGDNLDDPIIPGPPIEPAVNEDTSDWSFTGRIAGLPYYDEATPGRCLLHLGASWSARRTGQNAGTLGNGLWLGDLDLDDRTSLLRIQLNPREEFSVFNLETALVRGPASVQFEWYYAQTGDSRGIYTNGGYVQASYFLTGENRGYDRRMKRFDRVYPYEPFFFVNTCDGSSGGLGAWELAVRWDWKDLDSLPALAPGAAAGPTVIGTQENITLGCNWYLNPYSRVMLNYVHSITDYTFFGNSEGDHLGLRFQVDW